MKYLETLAALAVLVGAGLAFADPPKLPPSCPNCTVHIPPSPPPKPPPPPPEPPPPPH